MDVHGAHMAEWGDVLDAVERVVKVYAKRERLKISDFGGKCLEKLAKKCLDPDIEEGITYLPSRVTSVSNIDSSLVRLRRADRKTYQSVVRGELSMLEGKRRAGLAIDRRSPVARGKEFVRKMSQEELQEFVDWMVEEGFLE